MRDTEADRAARILREGGLVAFPTETVYGLGADAENTSAVERVFEVKGRPPGHPLIVHLPHAGALGAWASELPEAAGLLAERFWPGPLTLIVHRADRIPDAVTGDLDTVAIRVPDHPLALAMLEAFGGGVAAPSANRFGSVSPTTAEHVREDLSDEVDLILDGGPCRVGVESTIVDLTSADPQILRPGGVTPEELEQALERPIGISGEGGPPAPGRLPSHYAPSAAVAVVPRAEVARRASEEAAAGRRVGVLAVDPPPALPAGIAVLTLPPDAAASARELYATLRDADRRGLDLIVTSLPAETGLGYAVADRLRKAGAVREVR